MSDSDTLDKALRAAGWIQSNETNANRVAERDELLELRAKVSAHTEMDRKITELIRERDELLKQYTRCKSEIRRITESESDDAAQLLHDLELEINAEFERAKQAEAERDALRAKLSAHSNPMLMIELDRKVTELIHERNALSHELTGLRAQYELRTQVLRTEERIAAELRHEKDNAYAERDKCVALIVSMASALGCRAGLREHDPNDPDWDPNWRTVVYVDLPTGQVSWHIHESERHWFSQLKEYPGQWDGHNTKQKYERVLNATWRPTLPASDSPSDETLQRLCVIYNVAQSAAMERHPWDSLAPLRAVVRAVQNSLLPSNEDLGRITLTAILGVAGWSEKSLAGFNTPEHLQKTGAAIRAKLVKP